MTDITHIALSMTIGLLPNDMNNLRRELTIAEETTNDTATTIIAAKLEEKSKRAVFDYLTEIRRHVPRSERTPT